MLNPDKYRSVTWLKGGRTFPALDCFGIVNEVRRDLNLPPWPDFAGISKDDNGLDKAARKLMPSLSRCEPNEGAGVACYEGGIVSHVGIIVSLGGELRVCECNPGTNVTFLPLRRFIKRFVRVEFYQ